MSVNAVQYRAITNEYHRKWRLLDDALYRLCREYPDHTNRAQLNAKLWIIGRAYATGIERAIATKRTQGSSMTQLADHLFRHGKQINQWAHELQLLEEPLTAEMLATVVAVHGRFVKLLCPITRAGRSARSFVSKYLHFHAPVVPVYDSVAYGVLRTMMPWQDDFVLFPMPEKADANYGWYVMRFFVLYELALVAGLRPTVKEIDNYLLNMA